MKALKIVAFIVGGILVVFAVLLALAFTPAVQTWAVRKFANQPGMTVEVSRVAAGLSSAEILDLRFVKDGMVVAAKNVVAHYSAWDYISKHKINADSVAVGDLVVDLRNAAATQTANAPATAKTSQPATRTTAPTGTPKTASSTSPNGPFPGVLGQAQLPFDVRVASLVAQGRALLPAEQTVNFNLKGTRIETGQRGAIEWTVDFADGKAAAPLKTLHSTGSATLHIATDGRIDAVEIDTQATATGPQLPSDRVKLTAKAEQPAARGNEGYTANVGLVRSGNTVENLAKINAQFLVASREISGAWEIDVRSEQLAGLLGGLGLPQIAANGAGKFTVKPDTGAAAASGDLQGDASQLGKVSPALDAIGSVHFKTTFDGGVANNVAQLDKLALEVTARDGRKFAEVTALQKVTYNLGDKRVTLANPKGELARVSLQALPLAWAQSFAQPMQIESGDLSLVLSVEAEPDGSRVRARAVEPLALRSVTVRDANRKPLVEKVTLTVQPTIDYSAEKISARLADLKITLPAGDSVAGALNADVTNLATTPAIGFALQLQAKTIAALKPYLPLDPGPLAIETTTQGRMQGDVLNIAKSSTTINRATGGLLAAVELQQPVTANLKASSFTVPTPTAPLARVRLGQIPLSWAETFVPKSKFAGELTGATLEIAARSADDLTVNFPQPLVLRGVGATLDGKPMAQALDLTTELSATKRGNTISYEVRRLEVKQGETPLASLAVAGEAKLGAKFTGTAKGKLDADVAALMKQPVLAPQATLARGQLTTAFEAQLGDTIQAKAAVSAKNLVAKQGNRVLGDLELALDANVKPDGSGTINLPLTLANPQRKSDVLVNGAFGKTQKGDKFLFTGKIASTQIFVDDFQPLAALAPASSPAPTTVPATAPAQTQRQVSRAGQPIVVRAPTSPAATAATPPAAGGRDTVPVWNAVNGKVEVDLKRIVYGKDYIISGVRGSTVVTDTKLSLDGLEGRFKDNPFKVSGGLTFAANQPKPYTLAAVVDVSGVDVGELLRTPNEKPMIETKVKVAAKVNGSGANLGELGERVYGNFEVTGSKGVLRALGRKGEAIGTASTLLGIVGAAAGSGNTVALSRLGQELEEMEFDSFTMRAERDAALNLKFTSIEFLSPTKRLTGTGTVNYIEGAPYSDWPFSFEFNLAGKDFMAQLLNEVHALSGTQDDKGYYPMAASFPVSGTAAKVNNGLWKILLSTGVRAGLEGLLRR